MKATQALFDSIKDLPLDSIEEFQIKLAQALAEQLHCCRQIIDAEASRDNWGTEVKNFAASINRVLTVPTIVGRYATAKALAAAHLEREGVHPESLPL